MVLQAFRNPDDWDVYLIKLDAEGELDPRWPVNHRTFGGRESDWATSVAQAADGGYIVAGWTGPFGSRDVYLIKLAPVGSIAEQFLRGDCNDDGIVDISDAVCTLEWLFLGSEAPGCIAVTNVDGIGQVDITDPIYLLTHLFLGGPAPVAPFPDCGPGTLPTDEETCGTPSEHCPQ